MHIVHVVKHFPTTKLEYQEVALAREQINLGNDVTILTGDRHNDFPNYDENYYSIIGPRYVGTGKSVEEGITIIRLKLLDKINIFTRLKGLRRAIRKVKPDLIICHGYEVGLLPLQSCFKNIPLIIDSHYLDVYRKSAKKNLISILKRKIERIFFLIYGFLLKQHNVKFFGVTEESVNNISKLGLIPKERIKLIPLGVNLDSFYSSEDLKIEMRNKLDIPINDFVLIYTGKIEKYKGVHLLIEVLRQLRHNDLWLVIIGNGSIDYINYLKSLAEKYKVSDRVKHYPFSDKQMLNKYFNCADIAVYPLDVSISHIEAMATQLPIILENLPGVQHRVQNNNGYLVKFGNISMLAEKIEKLISDPELLQTMSSNSLELVNSKFKWDMINRQILSMH